MNFSVGNIPIDIVIFALIAGFLILRLRSVLGKKTGFENKDMAIFDKVKPPSFLTPHKNKPSQPVEPPAPKASLVSPAPDTAVGKTLQEISQLDSSFVPQKFLEGVEIVFRRILTAYAGSDVSALQSMLLPELYASFETVITGQKDRQEKRKIEIKTIHSIEIVNASIVEAEDAKKADVEVKIISDQLNYVVDKDNNPVIGAEAITEFIDFWVFERVLGVNGQGISWRLKSTRTGS